MALVIIVTTLILSLVISSIFYRSFEQSSTTITSQTTKNSSSTSSSLTTTLSSSAPNASSKPPSPLLVRANGYFLSTTPNMLEFNDSSFASLVRYLIADNVTYLYFNLPNMNPDGSINDSYSNESALIQRFQAASGNHTFEYIGWTGTQSNPLDIISNFTYSGIANTVKSLYVAGFRGILVDIEPVPNESPQFLVMMETFREDIMAETHGMLLGSSSMRLDPAAVPGEDWSWDPLYFARVSSILNFVVPMLFDTGASTEYEYENYVQAQVKLVAQYSNTSEVFALPDWYSNSTWHDPYVENLTNAITALSSYISSSGESPLPTMLGLAIFGLNKTFIFGQGYPAQALQTTPRDWNFFWSNWVNTSYPYVIGTKIG